MMINHDPEFVITLQRVIEFIGTFAFALSGIRLAASPVRLNTMSSHLALVWL